MRTLILAVLVAMAGAETWAQQSASYRIEEHVLNAGGHPAQGVSPGSATWRISSDSLGDSLIGAVLAGPSYQLAGGFLPAYPPPGEVMGLDLPAPATLVWNPEHSAGTYNVYRAAMSTLPSLTFGSCDQQGIVTTSAAAGANPPAGTGFFYLVTVENSLAEEGTKGFQGGGAERAGSACP